MYMITYATLSQRLRFRIVGHGRRLAGGLILVVSIGGLGARDGEVEVVLAVPDLTTVSVADVVAGCVTADNSGGSGGFRTGLLRHGWWCVEQGGDRRRELLGHGRERAEAQLRSQHPLLVEDIEPPGVRLAHLSQRSQDPAAQSIQAVQQIRGD